MNSLVWKEYRENARYFCLFVLWMVLTVAYALAYENAHQMKAVIGSFSGMSVLYALVAGIVLAVRTSRGEQVSGSMAFSSSLPVSLRRMATYRVASSILTLVTPIIIAALILSLAFALGWIEQRQPRPEDFGMTYERLPQREIATLPVTLAQLWGVSLVSAFAGVQFLLVLCVLSRWVNSQMQLGLSGVVLLLCAFVAAGALWMQGRMPVPQFVYGVLFPQSLAIQWSYEDLSGASYTDHELASHFWWALGLSTLPNVLLGRLFIANYGAEKHEKREVNGRSKTAVRRAAHQPLGYRWSSELRALVWLVMRQSIPVAGLGLLFACLISVVSVLFEPRGGMLVSAISELPHTIWFVGMLWAVIVGASIFSAELTSLDEFWRSRPIPISKWFWCKFFVGLLSVLLVLDGSVILVSWWAPRDGLSRGMSMTFIACVPLIHALLYSLSVFGACWLRKPLAGAFLAITVYAVVSMAIGFSSTTWAYDPINIFNELLDAERKGTVDFSQAGYPLVYGLIAVACAALALVAYWYVRVESVVSMKLSGDLE